MSEELLTKQQVAALLKISVRSIDRYRAAGCFRPVKVGRFIRFRKTQIDAIMERKGLQR